MDRDILRKAAAVFREGDDPVIADRFVSEHAEQHPVKRLCQLVEVPRSSFYEWRTRPLSDHYIDDAWLANEHLTTSMSRRAAPTGRHGFGASSATAAVCHSRKRVARIMAECGLVGVHGRRKWRRGETEHGAGTAIC